MGGGICISGSIYDQVVNKLALTYDNLGEQQVKNIAQAVRVYRVTSNPDGAGSRASILNQPGAGG